MDTIKIDYSQVPYNILDSILEWKSEIGAFACAAIELGHSGDYVYLGQESGEVVAIALVSFGNPCIMQFLATKQSGYGRAFVDYICHDCKHLALHAMNGSRGFYDRCGFINIGNGNYVYKEV